MATKDSNSERCYLPPTPRCEPERLEELEALGILDTAFEERFDRYTTLLASLFDFPVCLVSLVDADRQWFKSAHGFDFRETGRDLSFCAHALTQSDVFVISDTRADPRFASHPLVVGEPFVGFYAGAVLRGPTGMPLGTLCLIDHEPRKFGPRSRKHLQQFARLVERELVYNYELREARTAARYAANSDVLTDLPNRRYFEETLSHMIQTARSQSTALTVLHLDIVEFVRFNRSLGREAGDTVLKELGQRLRACCPPDGALGRLYADRFAMVMARDRNMEGAGPDPRIYELARGLSRPFFIGDREQYLRLRIGACSWSGPQDTAGTLLERAALASRKSGGGHCGTGVTLHFYNALLDATLEREFDLETRLRNALAHHQFSLAYQPLFDIPSGRIVSLEALIRWVEPELGNITPDEFIPLAEGTGLIREIGQWVLGEATRQCQQWHDEGLKLLPVHVNLSASELEEPEFTERATRILESADISDNWLCLEITETVLLRNLEDNIAKMKLLNQRGVKFYIDDFGKGYSSLQYLHKLPVAALKVDRSFVNQITTREGDATVARAIIALGRALGITVIAEGVETEEQLEFLRKAGCDQAQGYLLGRPAPAEQIGELMRRERIAG